MNKTIIYTVITSNYDTIKQPLVVEEGVEYILFTNNPEIIDAGVWRVVHISSEQWKGRYVDADMLIKRPLMQLLKDLHEDTLFAACKHSYCGSVMEEIEDLVAKGMVDFTQIENQWRRYVEWGFEDNMGILS